MNGQGIWDSHVDQIPSASVDELLCVKCLPCGELTEQMSAPSH